MAQEQLSFSVQALTSHSYSEIVLGFNCVRRLGGWAAPAPVSGCRGRVPGFLLGPLRLAARLVRGGEPVPGGGQPLPPFGPAGQRGMISLFFTDKLTARSGIRITLMKGLLAVAAATASSKLGVSWAVRWLAFLLGCPG